MSTFAFASKVWNPLLVCAVVLAGPPAVAQEKLVAGPQAAFEKMFETMRKNDWAACARLMHPDALAEFHRFFTSLAEMDDTGEVARQFFGIQESKDVAALAPVDAFERVMRGVIAANPGMDEIFSSATATTLGSVAEGDVVHVVYRAHMTVEGGSMSKIAVAPFKRHGDQWRGLLTGEMEGMIQALRSRAKE